MNTTTCTNSNQAHQKHELETRRLRLIPLDLAHLKLLRTDRSKMEKKLGLLPTNYDSNEKTAREMREACLMWIKQVSEDEANYVWYTNWEIVLKKENRSIGGFCFYGTPDEFGEVQIGYMLFPDYRKQGYITECLRAMVEWAFRQPQVKIIKVETPKDNIDSQQALERIGMRRRGETGETIWWRRIKEDKQRLFC